MSSLNTDITCIGCNLLCDDLTVRFDDHGDFECESSCFQAKKWIQTSLKIASASDSQETASLIQTAKKWLGESVSPLICGFDGLTLEAEAEVVNLAKQHQMTVCAGTSSEKAAVFQRYGGATCTLGEVRQRADLVLVGNCDLLTIWSRFGERFLEPGGRFLPDKKSRQLIFLGDASQLKDPSRYCEIIDVPSTQLDQAILILRRKIQGQAISRSELKQEVVDQLEDLSKKLLAAWYPVLFHETSQAPSHLLWTKLVNEVNQLSRMHSLGVKAGPACGNPSETILAITGFPDHLCFQNDEILYDVQKYQPTNLIENQETDLVIFVGEQLSEKWSETLEGLNSSAKSSSIKLIVIHSGLTKMPEFKVPVLEIRTQIPGIHESGTAIRVDGVPLPLRSLVASRLPTVSAVMRSLAE